MHLILEWSHVSIGICFIFQTFSSRDELIQASIKLAEEIASKSPVAIQATKKNLVYSLDHTNQEGLDHIVSHNPFILKSLLTKKLFTSSYSASNQQFEFTK